MSVPAGIAQLSQAAAYIPFLNLQYIYCYIASLFGKACAANAVAVTVPSVDTSGVEGAINTATTTVSNTVGQAEQGGFWSWLWPFGHSSTASDVVAATSTASDVGFWSGMFHALPTFLQNIVIGTGVLLSVLWSTFSFLSYTLSGLLVIAILVSAFGILYIRMSEWTEYGVLPARNNGHTYGWSRWQDLLNGAMSTEPKHWRVAIAAADDMLGELLTRIGYHGKSTSEQMRSIPEGAFVTLPAAWEAHRIKNFVAAKNSNFILTQREAFRVMKLYEQVFEEFDFI